MMQRSHVLAGLVMLLVSAACGGGGQNSPTDAQARDALQTKFEQARAGDPVAFCADTEVVAMCQNQWERRGGKDAVPQDPPRVASSREQDGYRVLRVCGTDGTGQDYRTDFVVGLDDGQITYALPLFWNGTTFSGVTDDDTGKVEQPAAGTDTSCS